LTVDKCGSRGSPVRPPGFGYKEVSTEEGDQPDNREKCQAHLPDLLKVMDSDSDSEKSKILLWIGGSLSQLRVTEARVQTKEIRVSIR
jgi:hypothetical protein